MRVMKFGGSCLQDGSGLPRVAELAQEAGAPLCVVLSALKGVTDQLGDVCLRAVLDGFSPTDVEVLLGLHTRLLESLSAPARERAEAGLNSLCAELRAALKAIAKAGATPELQDRVLSWGERASCAVAVEHLREAGLDAVLLEGADAGVVTTSDHCHAFPLPEAAALARQALSGERVFVVPGFVGQDAHGAWTTLGRGGSDTTAAFLGLALSAPVTLWKDTALLSADPEFVPQAQVLTEVIPVDALELAIGGLPAIAVDALEIARAGKLPLVVRAFQSDACSEIVAGANSRAAVVWVSAAPGTVRVTLVGGPPDARALQSRAAASLEAAGVDAASSALTPSGRNHSWTVPAAVRAKAVRALHRAFVEDERH